jgi:hypothetical protein
MGFHFTIAMFPAMRTCRASLTFASSQLGFVEAGVLSINVLRCITLRLESLQHALLRLNVQMPG